MKVFCENCKWFGQNLENVRMCFYVKDLKKTPKRIDRILAETDEDNKNNNCPFFREKGFLQKMFRFLEE